MTRHQIARATSQCWGRSGTQGGGDKAELRLIRLLNLCSRPEKGLNPPFSREVGPVPRVDIWTTFSWSPPRRELL